jgi:nucleoside phosphorylase/NTP pyrophosphatase (non-canonical NTP hydrolase)
MTLGPIKSTPTYTLDDLYAMVSSIYADQNSHRSPSSTFSHFVEVCGMLTVHDRKKKREGIGVEDALCKALGWFFPLMAKFGVRSVEEMIFRKYPYVCPYCRACPHIDAMCKTTKGVTATLDHAAVDEKRIQNRSRRPHQLTDWQHMFQEIYPRDSTTLGYGRSTLGLFEELGELAEAVRVFEKYPKYFAGEAADVFSYLMGIANEYRVKSQLEEEQVFDFEAIFLRKYPGMCIQCGHQSCICPSIPESTVGRLAKEIDIPAHENLFGFDAAKAEDHGRKVGESVLQDLGGLPAIAHQLPLDRGEANQALVLLCLKLSQEIAHKNNTLASNLQAAAIQIATDTRTPGSKAHGGASGAVLELLAQVWPLLHLAVIPDDRSLPARLGSLIRAQSVRIGIVTALPKEFAAMRMMLDEEAPMAKTGDPNDYVLGRIQSTVSGIDHLVVVTLLKEIGNNSAASAATNLLRSFPKVEDILMVGIAGGIPSPATESHIRLGDIVVSNKEGVIQYDNLKIEPQEIKIRSSSSKPSARMIGAINVLESERLMKKFPWEEFVSRATQLENAARPNDASDILLDSTGQETQHPIDGSRRPGQPKVHLGRIGAANILLKNRTLRDQLRKEHRVIAIEMEGSGVADASWSAGQQYLVIRGICDYCDEFKNDSWQGYAAAVAAAYARSLISTINPDSYQWAEF